MGNASSIRSDMPSSTPNNRVYPHDLPSTMRAANASHKRALTEDDNPTRAAPKAARYSNTASPLAGWRCRSLMDEPPPQVSFSKQLVSGEIASGLECDTEGHITSQQKAQLWYSSTEMAAFKKEIKAQLLAITTSGRHARAMDSHGLESLLNPSRRLAKKRYLADFMTTQACLRHLPKEFSQADILAKNSLSNTQAPKLQALLIATGHRAFVETEYGLEPNCWNVFCNQTQFFFED